MPRYPSRTLTPLLGVPLLLLRQSPRPGGSYSAGAISFMSPLFAVLLAVAFSLVWLAGVIAIWSLSPFLGAGVLVLVVYAIYDLAKEADEL
jgi:hypothetical protein